jgi:cobalt/nickel transport system permease protein
MGFHISLNNNPIQSSPLSRLDPRVKVVMILTLITGIVLTPEGAWPAYPLLWALIGTLAAFAQVSAQQLAWKGRIALPFTLAAVGLLFTMPGNAGLIRFGSIVLKSWLAVQAALLLSLTTPFPDLLWALGRLRVPGILIAIISFMYRYLFTLEDEAQRLMRARASRSGSFPGQKSGGGLLWRARTAGNMVGNLFLRSYERSERVYAAMLARGYQGQIRLMDPPRLATRAILLGAIPVLALLIIETLAVLWWSH